MLGALTPPFRVWTKRRHLGFRKESLPRSANPLYLDESYPGTREN